MRKARKFTPKVLLCACFVLFCTYFVLSCREENIRTESLSENNGTGPFVAFVSKGENAELKIYTEKDGEYITSIPNDISKMEIENREKYGENFKFGYLIPKESWSDIPVYYGEIDSFRWVFLATVKDSGGGYNPLCVSFDDGRSWIYKDTYDLPSDVLTGAVFVSDKVGFIGYRYFEDFGPKIYRTLDGGTIFERIELPMPQGFEYENSVDAPRMTPLVPTFKENTVIYPVELRFNTRFGTPVGSKIINLVSDDGGMTFKWENDTERTLISLLYKTRGEICEQYGTQLKYEYYENAESRTAYSINALPGVRLVYYDTKQDTEIYDFKSADELILSEGFEGEFYTLKIGENIENIESAFKKFEWERASYNTVMSLVTTFDNHTIELRIMPEESLEIPDESTASASKWGRFYLDFCKQPSGKILEIRIRNRLYDNIGQIFEEAEQVYGLFTGETPLEFTGESITEFGIKYDEVKSDILQDNNDLRILVEKYFSGSIVDTLINTNLGGNPLYITRDVNPGYFKLYRQSGFVSECENLNANKSYNNIQNANGGYAVDISAVHNFSGKEISVNKRYRFELNPLHEVRFTGFPLTMSDNLYREYLESQKVRRVKIALPESDDGREWVLVSLVGEENSGYIEPIDRTHFYINAWGEDEMLFTFGKRKSDYEPHTFIDYRTFEVVTENDSIVHTAELENNIVTPFFSTAPNPYPEKYIPSGEAYYTKAYNGGTHNFRISVQGNAIEIGAYLDGTDAGGTYRGTYNYNNITGELSARLNFNYVDGSTGERSQTDAGTVTGKLVEYGNFVAFICSDNGNTTISEYIPLIFKKSEKVIPVQEPTGAPFRVPEENYKYLFSKNIFMSQTQLHFFSLYKVDESTGMFEDEPYDFAVYCTNGKDEPFKIDAKIPERFEYDSIYPVACDYGAGSGETRFVLALIEDGKTSFVSFDNFEYDENKSYLEFDFRGRLDGQNLEFFYETYPGIVEEYSKSILDIVDWKKLGLEEKGQSYTFFYNMVSGECKIPEINDLEITNYKITLLPGQDNHSTWYRFDFEVVGNSLPETLPPGKYTKYINETVDIFMYDEFAISGRKWKEQTDKSKGLSDFPDNEAAYRVSLYLDYTAPQYMPMSESGDRIYAAAFIALYYGGDEAKLSYDDMKKALKNIFRISDIKPIEEIDNPQYYFYKCTLDKESGMISFTETRGSEPVYKIIDASAYDGYATITVQLYADRYRLIPSHKVEYVLYLDGGIEEVRIAQKGKYEPNSQRGSF